MPRGPYFKTEVSSPISMISRRIVKLPTQKRVANIGRISVDSLNRDLQPILHIKSEFGSRDGDLQPQSNGHRVLDACSLTDDGRLLTYEESSR